MRIEIPTGFKVGEIANTASVLVDEVVKVGVQGTQIWPELKQGWINHIKGVKKYRHDLAVWGLRLGYRGFIDNLIHMERRGISLLFDEPRILIFADEEVLSATQMVDISYVIHDVASKYTLKEQLPPPSLVFPKEEYATEIVTFDSHDLNIH